METRLSHSMLDHKTQRNCIILSRLIYKFEFATQLIHSLDPMNPIPISHANP